MSRTHRTPTSSYYGYTPVRADEVRDNTASGTQYHRERWYLGYDGGWRGAVGRAYRVRDDWSVGYRDYGCTRGRKRFEKKRARRLSRQIARERLRADDAVILDCVDEYRPVFDAAIVHSLF